MNIALLAIAIVGGLGLIFSVGLSIASIYLSIKTDPRYDKILSALAGANCGACGYPGCSGYAKAILSGTNFNLCTPGGQKSLDSISEVLGKKAELKAKEVARVHCNGTEANCERRIEYDGVKTCKATTIMTDSTKKCLYGCEGYGDCVVSCLFGAIHMGPGKVPIVDEEKCTACGKCVKACPKHLITIEPYDIRTYAACSNPDKGKAVTSVCKVGCISCELCVKKCPRGALTMKNGVPVWDNKKCDNRGVCAAVCPTGAIHDIRKHVTKAFIAPDECVGIGECVKACPIRNCITGEPGKKHTVNPDLCCGCELCVPVCPSKAISMTGKGTSKRKSA